MTENEIFWLDHMARLGTDLADGCPPIQSLVARGLAQTDKEGWTTLTDAGRAILESEKAP
jgi:hypothetical protein